MREVELFWGCGEEAGGQLPAVDLGCSAGTGSAEEGVANWAGRLVRSDGPVEANH